MPWPGPASRWVEREAPGGLRESRWPLQAKPRATSDFCPTPPGRPGGLRQNPTSPGAACSARAALAVEARGLALERPESRLWPGPGAPLPAEQAGTSGAGATAPGAQRQLDPILHAQLAVQRRQVRLDRVLR